MKVEVLNRFRDKSTHQIFEVGSLYESSDKARIDLLVKKGFVKSTNVKAKTPTLNLEGNVKEVTSSINLELGRSSLRDALKAEQADKNRKGVTEHIESLLAELDEKEGDK